jgi:serine/threonine protein kinase
MSTPDSARRHSTRSVRAERLPYPLGALWSAAAKTEQLTEVHRAIENTVRFMTAVLLADSLDLPWTDKCQALLSGGSDGRGLEKMTLGTRVHLLRALVASHAAAPKRDDLVLPVLDGWLKDINPLLDACVARRNTVIHGAGSHDKDALEEARAHLTDLLRRSRWLRELQLLEVERPAVVDGRRKEGFVQRHLGLEFRHPQHRTGTSWWGDFRQGRLHLGGRDGSKWVVCPFLKLEGKGLWVLDGITFSGELRFGQPLGSNAEKTQLDVGLPTDDGRTLEWKTFVVRRFDVAPTYRITEARPSRELVCPVSAAPTLTEGNVIGDDYRLVRQLGQGGMASVWEVEDIHDGRHWALKIPDLERLDAEFEQRFKREIDLLKSLQRDGVRRIVSPVDRRHVLLDDEWVPVLRMPVLRATLAERLAAMRRSGSTLESATVRRWACQVLEALSDLHARGTVHRDIKPSNLLLDAHDDVVLTDFGIARGHLSELTKTAMAMGSEHYMAPEQLRSAKDVTGKADLFALAVTLHELLTGERPSVPGKGLPGEFGRLVEAMGRQDPHERPTAQEALARLTTDDGEPRVPTSPAPPRPGAPESMDTPFASRLLVVCDTAGGHVVPDWPFADPRWVAEAVEKPIVHLSRGTDGALESVEYTVRLRSDATPRTHRYETADLFILSRYDDDPGEQAPLRALVWPDTPLVDWSHYAIHVDRRAHDWSNASWGVYTRVERSPAADGPTFGVEACRARSAGTGHGDQEVSSLGRVSGRDSACVVSRDRPAWLLVELPAGAGRRASGLFDLLPPATHARPAGTPVELGVDIGAHETCVSYRVGGVGRVHSVDFHQLRANGTGARRPVFSRFDRGEDVRSNRPFVPGVPGDGAEGRHEGSLAPLTRLASALFVPSADTRPEASATQVPLKDFGVLAPQQEDTFRHGDMARADLPGSSATDVHASDQARFLTTVLLFAAARIERSEFDLRVAVPTSIPETTRATYERAIREACRWAGSLTGCRFTFTALAPAREAGRRVAAAHARHMRPEGIPLIVACDLKDDSVELTVATFPMDCAEREREASLVVLASDSVAFGVEAPLRRACRIARPSLYREEQSDEVVWRHFGQRISRMGLLSVVADLPEKDGAKVVGAFVAYLDLIVEYVCRIVAATIRNPYRLGGAVRMQVAKGGAVADIPLAEAGSLFQYDGEDWTGTAPIQVALVATGSGWRLLDAATEGQLTSAGKDVPRSVEHLTKRVVELCQEGIQKQDAPVRRALRDLEEPTMAFHPGLKRTGDAHVLEEAGADALAVAGGGLLEASRPSPGWSTPVGFGGLQRSIEDTLKGKKPPETPWYAFAGERSVTGPSLGTASHPVLRDQVPPPDAKTSWKSPLQPEFPSKLLKACRRLEIDLEKAIDDCLEEVDAPWRSDDNDSSRHSLLHHLYEVHFSQQFRG